MLTVRLIVLILSFKLVLGEEEGFIVGGDYVDSIKKFPHVAFLTMIMPNHGGTFMCGSSILNQAILITAAHCLDDVILMTAVVGSINRDEGIMHRISSHVQHKRWNKIKIIHDIALCKLKRPLKLGYTVKRVMLMQHPPKAKKADLAGWGAVEEREYSETRILKHTVQKLWDIHQCRQVIYDAPAGTICGGESRARANYASRGDSGSGLLIHSQIIVGLVSFKETSVSRSLVVYTDVPHFYHWIMEKSKQLYCS